jgi:hypothetical protein
MSRKHRNKTTACPNCGTALQQGFEFCPQCGQENHDLRVPFKHFAYEFVENLTHFDTKLWSTLKMIFTKPGQLTKDFVEGKRARYVHPVRFYVFTSVIFFALLTWWVDRGIHVSITAGEGPRSAVSTLHDMLPDNVLRPLKNDSQLVARLYLPIDSPWYGAMRKRLLTGNSALFDSLLSTAQVDTSAGLRQRLTDAVSHLPDVGSLDVQRQVSFLGNEHVTFPNKEEQERFMRIGADMTDEQADSILRTGTDTTSSWLKRRAIRSIGRLQVGSTQGAYRMAHLAIKSISFIMFLLMPFTAVLLLWVFYPKRYYWEHLIFSVHIHTIFFLYFSILLLFALVLPGEWPDWLLAPAMLVCLGYLVLSLRTVYGKRWTSTLMRFLVMSIPYFIVFILLFVTGLFWGFISL